MKSRRGVKSKNAKRKIAAGIVSLTVIVAATAGISYADTDLTGSMTAWFTKKTEQVMKGMDLALKSEEEVQKEQLKKELQLRLEASARHLDTFTEDQKRQFKEALSQYAEGLLSKMDIRSAQDREQITMKLQAILSSAQSSMDALANSYVPPAVLFIPPPQITAPGTPQQPPTVTTDVYGQPVKPATVVETTYH